MIASDQGYRPDVDGLRAVAVLLVLLFHLGVAPFGGGYIGVDVFFVISGFLITRLIHEELSQTGGFSFARFYVRRLRRLFPAFMATVVLCLVAGFVLFSPDLMERFSGAALFSILSVSNIYFWMESGYFDTTATLKPLLHMWSLGVEEQFYLVWPPALVALTLLAPRRAVPVVLAAAGVASLAAAQYVVHRDAAAAFFLTPFRVYEFALGAILVWTGGASAHPRAIREGALALGLALIVVPAALFTDATPFPGLNALYPSVGAALVIYSGPATVLGLLLRNRVMVAIGLVSYSLYLVHWPIIVFYRYYVFRELSGAEKAGIAIAALVLAALMYRFVERPFRRPVAPAARGSLRYVSACVAVAALFAGSSAYAWVAGGLPWRMPDAMTAEEVQAGKARRFSVVNRACAIQDFPAGRRCNADAALQVLFIGNSHEPDALNAFHAIYGDRPDVNMIAFGTVNRCEFSVENDAIVVTGGEAHCRPRFEKLGDPDFAKGLDIVIVGLNRPFIAGAAPVWDAVRTLKHANPDIEVVGLGGYLNLSIYCPELFNRFGTFEACKRREYVSVFEPDERDSPVFREAGDLRMTFIDRIGLLCADGTLDSCLTSGGGEPFTYDAHHLSLGFATLLGQRLSERYASELRALGFPPVGDGNGGGDATPGS